MVSHNGASDDKNPDKNGPEACHISVGAVAQVVKGNFVFSRRKTSRCA